MKKRITLVALFALFFTAAVIYADSEGTDHKCCHWNYVQHLVDF